MLAIMRNSIKTRQNSCIIQGNQFCISVLSLLREQGLIYGFSFLNKPRKQKLGFWHGYPRIQIYFKFLDKNTFVLKDVKSFKNTRSNYYHLKNKINRPDSHHILLLSNYKGLSLTSFFDFQNKRNYLNHGRFNGKLLAEFLL